MRFRHLGPRPTFDSHEPVLEVHLLDFAAEIYGATLEIGFVTRLRGQHRFAGPAELRAQIEADVEAARRALSS